MIKVQNPMSVSTVLPGGTEAVNAGADEIHVATPTTAPVVSPEAGTVKSVAKQKTKFSMRGAFEKIRRVKHIEIYAAVIVIAIMLLIFITPSGTTGDRSNNNGNNLTTIETNFVRDMERQLISVLSNIQGAGRVETMITAVGSSTLEIAMSIDERSVTQSGTGGASTTTTTVTKTPIIVGGNPIVVTETKPQIRGVVVVASGASDPGVRLAILRAVQTLVGDPGVRVEVLARTT